MKIATSNIGVNNFSRLKNYLRPTGSKFIQMLWLTRFKPLYSKHVLRFVRADMQICVRTHVRPRGKNALGLTAISGLNVEVRAIILMLVDDISQTHNIITNSLARFLVA